MKYLRIFLLYSQHVFQYRARIFVWFLISFLNPFILLMFWKGALKPGEVLNGWTNISIQSYYLLVIIIQAMLISHIEINVAIEDIKGGELAKYLLKPMNYLWLKLSDESTWRLTQGAYGILVILTFYFFKIYVVVSKGLVILTLALCICIFAFILSFFFKMVLGLLAFWMTDVYGVLETNDVLLLLFSGTLMPFDLLPKWIQTVAQYTPFPYFVYYPVAAFIGKFSSSQLLFIVVQEFIWIVGLYLLYRIMWNFGTKKFAGVGQ